MRDEHFKNLLGRAAYRSALAARHVRRRHSNSFGREDCGSVGHIYVINLDRQSGRWHQIQRELAHVCDGRGVPLAALTTRLSAVDARDDVQPAAEYVRVDYTLADQLYVDPHPLPRSMRSPAEIPIKMSREEVAVALSHVKAWGLIASGGDQYSLVLEDDVYFLRAFAKLFDSAWSTLKERRMDLDLLYLSYAEARAGAEWAVAPSPMRRPIRGVWQLSGYVLSKRGAAKLLDMLPVCGPIDLWINFMFGGLDVFALSRPVMKQRLDVPSSNFYSALPVLSTVGLLDSDKPPTIKWPIVQGPIFGVGGPGVTALATALSMLGYRCFSDVTVLPNSEWKALFDQSRPRVFDAYVNVGSLGPTTLRHLAGLHPESKFIFTGSSCDGHLRDSGSLGSAQPNGWDDDTFDALQADIGADTVSPRCLSLPAAHHDKWQLLADFLGCNYPSPRYPQCADQPRRPIRHHDAGLRAPHLPRRVLLEWDSLPWIAAVDGWHGVALVEPGETPQEGVMEQFGTSDSRRWLLRDDTFPGNLALFRPSNFEWSEDAVGQLSLRRERTPVRDLTSAALSTRSSYRYGRFAADLMPARVSGLVTGMFLHRNSPRQEIDIEFVGNDTTKLLINVYFNPGEEGARLEYGYRGTPELIDLGFDAADAFHRYDIEWTPERIRWRVDGRVVCERQHWAPTPVPHLPMQFHINLWHTRSAALAGKLDRQWLPAHSYLRRVEVTPAFRPEA